MKKPSIIALLLAALAPAVSFAATFDGDLWITNDLLVGTTLPGARFEVRASSNTETVFQASAVDETPLLMVDHSGKIGLSTMPAANLDIMGYGDIGDIGLQLKNGNLYPNTSRYQITFGYAGQALYRHAIRTRHADSLENNSVDFLLWTPASGTSSAVGNVLALSLVSSSTANSGSMHINPVGAAQHELVVSNGVTNGGGTMMRAQERNPSSRELKTDITYLEPDEERRAYDEIAGSRHISFRYKGMKGFKRGLLYEESPASIRRPGKTLSRNARVTNAEMALKELMRRLDALEGQVPGSGAGGGQ